MNNMLLKLYVKFQNLKNDEDGQDLVEYALVVALIAIGANFHLVVTLTRLSESHQFGVRFARKDEGAEGGVTWRKLICAF